MLQPSTKPQFVQGSLQPGVYYMPVTLTRENGPIQPIDPDANTALITRLIERGGATNIVVGGASGEGHEHDEADQILLGKLGLQAAQKRANIYVGIPPVATKTALRICDALMPLGLAGVMEFPPCFPYGNVEGLETRYRMISKASGRKLMVYAKEIVGLPTDALLVRLAGEGIIAAVKRACDAVPFRQTARLVRAANPDVLVIQGAAEKNVLGVLDCADGYTSGTGVVFPRISAKLEAAFLARDFAQVAELTGLFEPIESMRAENGTGYNICVLKHLLLHCYGMGNAKVRPATMPLGKQDVARLEALAKPLFEMDSRLPL